MIVWLCALQLLLQSVCVLAFLRFLLFGLGRSASLMAAMAVRLGKNAQCHHQYQRCCQISVWWLLWAFDFNDFDGSEEG